MSWLSEWLGDLFGGDDDDNTAAILAQQQQAAREAEARAAAEAERQRQFQASQTQMQVDYLNQLRSDQLAAEAKEEAKTIAADPTETRRAAQTALSGYFTPEFERGFVPTTITDPFEQAAYAEQRAAADEYLNRMFKRGVITESGRAAGTAELERQAPRARQQLQDIADVLLEQERGKLTGIAGRGRERAATLGVGEAFDITPYRTAAESELGTFTSGLSDLYKSQVPQNLFDVSGLGAIAGGAQFAGNRPFAPDITPTPSDETDPFTGQKPVQKRTSTVF